MTAGYWAAAAATWWIGFFPLTELYIAVPAAIAMGLDYPSAVFWTVFGNATPLVAVRLLFDRLMQHQRLGPFLDRNVARRVSDRWRDRLERNPVWLFLLTPLAGVWATAVVSESMRLKPMAWLSWSALSVVIFSTIAAALVHLGLLATDVAVQIVK